MPLLAVIRARYRLIATPGAVLFLTVAPVLVGYLTFQSAWYDATVRLPRGSPPKETKDIVGESKDSFFSFEYGSPPAFELYGHVELILTHFDPVRGELHGIVTFEPKGDVERFQKVLEASWLIVEDFCKEYGIAEVKATTKIERAFRVRLDNDLRRFPFDSFKSCLSVFLESRSDLPEDIIKNAKPFRTGRTTQISLENGKTRVTMFAEQWYLLPIDIRVSKLVSFKPADYRVIHGFDDPFGGEGKIFKPNLSFGFDAGRGFAKMVFVIFVASFGIVFVLATVLILRTPKNVDASLNLAVLALTVVFVIPLVRELLGKPSFNVPTLPDFFQASAIVATLELAILALYKAARTPKEKTPSAPS